MKMELKRRTVVLVTGAVLAVIAVALGWFISANHEAEAYAASGGSVEVDVAGDEMLSMTASDVLLTVEEQAAIKAEAEAKAQAEAEAAEEAAVQAEEYVGEYVEDWSDYGYFEEDDEGEVWFIPYDGSGRYNANLDGAWYESSQFAFDGKYKDDGSGFTFTYYPESVLPGGGLDIPGRHVNDDGYVVDGDGNLCIASDNLPPGTVVDVPFSTGVGVVYDSGSGDGNLDMYVSW